MQIPPPEIIRVETEYVACEGIGGALGHPRVWLRMGSSGYADCGYCDRRFVVAGGPADTGADGEPAPISAP